MPYADWPLDAYPPHEGMEVGLSLDAQLATAESGIEQRAQVGADGIWQFKMAYEKTTTPASLLFGLFNFYRARGGIVEPFMFHDPDSRGIWTGVEITAPSGTTYGYWMPCREDTSNAAIVIYKAGVAKTLGVDYTLASGGSTGNYRKHVVFTANPGTAVLTCDFVGRRSHVVRFAEKMQTYQTFSANAYSFGIPLKSVKGE